MERGAHLPADRGMSGLGLIMELAGSLFATLTATVASVQLLAMSEMRRDGGEDRLSMWLLLLTGAGVVRSLFHRAAGIELLYGAQPARALRSYYLVAGLHTLLWIGFAAGKLHAPPARWLTGALLFGAWPVALGLVLRIPELRLVAGPVPRSGDRGFAGLTVLMIVLGLVGTLFATAALLSLLQIDGAGEGIYALLIAIVVLLVARSLVHTHAGAMMLGDLTLERAETATGRYGNLGVISGIAIGAAGLIIAMKERGSVLAAIPIGGVTLLLLMWPQIVRRFATARRLEAYVDDREPSLARASDQGRTTLGWLLLGLGVFAAATTLPAALFDGAATAPDDGVGMLVVALARLPTRAPWLAVAVAGLQVWAGIELILMTPRHRTLATVYGIAAVVVALYINLPILRRLERLNAAMPGSTDQTVIAALAIGLVVPLVTIAIVQRRPLPQLRGEVGRIFE